MRGILSLPLVAVLLFSCASAFGQVYEAKSCVYREGDDMRWARPDYDDSAWSKVIARPGEIRPPGPSLWVRCRIGPVPADAKEPLFVYLSKRAAWQMFVNGVEAGAQGNMNSGRSPLDTHRILPIPREARGASLLVAVRILARGDDAARNVRPVAGGRTALELHAVRRRAASFSGEPVDFVMCPVFLVLGMIMLVMSFAGRQKDTLFFAITLLGRGMIIVSSLLAVGQARLPGDVGLLINAAGNIAISFHAYFFYAFRNRRIPRFYQLCFWVATMPFALWLLSDAAPAPVAFRLFSFLFFGPFSLVSHGAVILLDTSWIAAFLPLKSLRKQDLPFFVLTVIYFATQVMVPATQLPWIGDVSLRATARNFTAAAQLPVIFYFIIVLTLRIKRTGEREVLLQRDMDAAREMQRRLVPEAQPIPGFHIDTAYLPAREVGGDFYQFLPGDDGSLLVVVGDVSGKGLDAAMVVSTIIGALKNEDSRDPARLLERLNRVLAGGRGFVTCSCALFRQDGSVEMANAGHMPPYLDGREIALEPGPPLGIIADAEYESTRFSSRTGVFTFFSDGVVEATNATGELLGFERLAGLSVKPAREIAKEAERWGQEDDITVVQVAYA